MSIGIQRRRLRRVAEETDKLIQRSYRLPESQVEMIEALAAKKVLGGNKSDVLRTLLDRAIKELIETEYVRKKADTMKRLKK
jgi:hypothetical protein